MQIKDYVVHMIPFEKERRRDRVHRANQIVHASMATVYREVEPHFRPENRLKVRRRLERLAEVTPSNSLLLDMGCGTGFILDLARGLFEHMHGVDITPEMLSRVDTTHGDVSVECTPVENLTFVDSSFDMITAYSFIDHLDDYRIVLREMFRLLKPGGVAYIDLVPNSEFWSEIHAASISSVSSDLQPIVRREVEELVNHELKMEKEFGIRPEDWRDCEPSKSNTKGLKKDDLEIQCAEIGFQKVDIYREWFLGEAVVHHEQSPELATSFDAHLAKLSPLTDHLYKYLVIELTK